MNINNEHEHKRALLFQEREMMVHVLKKDGIFLNGTIVEVGYDFIILKDYIQQKDYMILFQELKKPLEPFKDVK